MAEKYLWNSINNFSKLSLYFRKMSNTSRNVLHKVWQRHIQKYPFLCDTIYRLPEAVMRGSLKVLEKSLRTVLDTVHFRNV